MGSGLDPAETACAMVEAAVASGLDPAETAEGTQAVLVEAKRQAVAERRLQAAVTQ